MGVASERSCPPLHHGRILLRSPTTFGRWPAVDVRIQSYMSMRCIQPHLHHGGPSEGSQVIHKSSRCHRLRIRDACPCRYSVSEFPALLLAARRPRCIVRLHAVNMTGYHQCLLFRAACQAGHRHPVPGTPSVRACFPIVKRHLHDENRVSYSFLPQCLSARIPSFEIQLLLTLPRVQACYRA